MSVVSEIERIKTNIENAYTELENKGATIPSEKNSNNLSSTIAEMPTGGGGEDIGEYMLTEASITSQSTTTTNAHYLIKKIGKMKVGTGSYALFGGCYNLTEIDTLDYQNNSATAYYTCYNCRALVTVKRIINSANVTNFESFFRQCYALKNIPQSIDTSGATNLGYMFHSCNALENVPILDCSKATNATYMFNGCYNLKKIQLKNTSNITNMSYMFNDCNALTEFPTDENGNPLDLSNVTNISRMFQMATVKMKEVPSLNTRKATNMSYFLGLNTNQYTLALEKVGKLYGDSCTTINDFFGSGSSYAKCLKNFTDFGGIENLGMAYSTTSNANLGNYTLSLLNTTYLSEQSLINVLNGLYDIATAGCQTQRCTLGSTNLAKLTSEAGQQALINAQNKGWTIS